MANGIKSAAVSYATAGTQATIAAPTKGKIRIHGIALAAAADVTATLKDGSTALTGAMTLAKTAGPLSLGVPPDPNRILWELSAEAAFNITLGGAVQVSGTVWYTIHRYNTYAAPGNDQIP